MYKYLWLAAGILIIATIVIAAYGTIENMESEEKPEDMNYVNGDELRSTMPPNDELPNVEIKDVVSGYDNDEIIQAEIFENPAQFLLDDGMNREASTIGNLCSFNCCSPGWGVKKVDDGVDNPDKYIKTNLYCRNGTQSSGCMCVTKTQRDHIASRGGNAK